MGAPWDWGFCLQSDLWLSMEPGEVGQNVSKGINHLCFPCRVSRRYGRMVALFPPILIKWPVLVNQHLRLPLIHSLPLCSSHTGLQLLQTHQAGSSLRTFAPAVLSTCSSRHPPGSFPAFTQCHIFNKASWASLFRIAPTPGTPHPASYLFLFLNIHHLLTSYIHIHVTHLPPSVRMWAFQGQGLVSLLLTAVSPALGQLPGGYWYSIAVYWISEGVAEPSEPLAFCCSA